MQHPLDCNRLLWYSQVSTDTSISCNAGQVTTFSSISLLLFLVHLHQFQDYKCNPKEVVGDGKG